MQDYITEFEYILIYFSLSESEKYDNFHSIMTVIYMPLTSVFQFPRPCWCVCVCVCVCASHRCSSCVWCVCVLSSGQGGCERSPCGSCVWSPRSPRSLDGDKTTRAHSDITHSPLSDTAHNYSQIPVKHAYQDAETHTPSSLTNKVCV